MVAVVFGAQARVWRDGGYVDAPVDSPNARLIAAAPDLLAALKAVLDVGAADAAACEVTFGLCPETTHCPECDARRAAIRIATTAIAKAEGRDRG